jgi:Prealbumin-like fold domain
LHCTFVAGTVTLMVKVCAALVGQTVIDNDDPEAGDVPDEDPDVGEVCVSGLDVGDYTVNETSPPPGYGPAPADQADQTVTVENNTDCTVDGYPTNAVANFTNAPLADIQVNFRDGGSGETVLTGNEISCNNETGDTDSTPATDWDASDTVTGVEIDPSPVTITCTIEIDP